MTHFPFLISCSSKCNEVNLQAQLEHTFLTHLYEAKKCAFFKFEVHICKSICTALWKCATYILCLTLS